MAWATKSQSLARSSAFLSLIASERADDSDDWSPFVDALRLNEALFIS